MDKKHNHKRIPAEVPVFVKKIKSYLICKKQSVLPLLLGIVLISASLYFLFFYENHDKDNDSKTPKLDIGCSQVVWVDEQVELAASVTNAQGDFTYTWWTDGTILSNSQQINPAFSPGEHTIRAEASNGIMTLENEITVRAVSTVDDISVEPEHSDTYGFWKFPAYYNDIPVNVPGTLITMAGTEIGSSTQCRPANIIGVPAGTYSWSAQYHDQIIGSGTIEVPPVQALKVLSIDIRPRYSAGETISSYLLVTNTGTVDVTGYNVRIMVVNNKYSWMGDAARREYNFNYADTLGPGEPARIPINVKIPEKVQGIRPTGKYTIDVELLYGDRESSSVTLKTEVV